MTSFKVRVSIAAVMLMLWVAATARVASAVTIDFENPPYSEGTIVGQQGWVTNGYVGGAFFGGPNGNVTTSSTAPLGGSQSLAFDQTAVTGGGGAPGASDVSKPEVIAITPGQLGTDLTASYLISASGNSLNPNGSAGVFLSHDAHLGDSPLFARLDGSALVVADTGTIVQVPDFVYFAGDVLEITMNVDLDVSRYELSVNNLSTGQFEFARSFGFLSPFAAEGPNGEYLVDVGTMLRRGTAKIDNFSLVAATGPLVTELTWGIDASGNWNQAANWTPGGVPGSSPGRQTAILGDAITSTRTVFTNSSTAVNSVQFDNENTYVIAGAGSIDLQADNSAGAPINPSIQVDRGHHQFQVAVNLRDDATVSVAAGAALDFNNQIDLGGNKLTISGEVNINHSTVGGGMVVSSGLLGTRGVVDIGGDLVSTGSLLVHVESSGADLFKVAGNATLSGTLEVVLESGAAPVGPLTILSAGGSLDATRLSLDASQVGTFALSTTGGNLMLTYIGATIPEPTSLGLGLSCVAGVLFLRRVRGLSRNALLVAALPFAWTMAPSASAAVIDFEDPPYVAGQTIVGQDGWSTKDHIFSDPFFGGVVNGTVDISATGPLAGLQSVLYTQTVDPSADGTGGSDVGKPDVVAAVKHGTAAADLTASFLIQTDANSVGNGSMGLFLGPGEGHSPVFVLLSNANSTNGTGDILVAHDFSVSNVGTYVPNNTFEITLGVDVDNQKYDVFARNVTAGTPAVKLSPASGFAFFGGGIPDDGDGQTFTLDASLLLRSGTGRIDQITLTPIPEPTTLGLALLSVAAIASLRRVRGLARHALPAVALISALAATQRTSAAVIDFENPPYIAGQTIVGQDEWFTKEYVFDDPFFGGVVNGTVDISATGPLAGLQSVLYTQTVDPPSAGVTGASDVGKPNVVFAVKDGTDAADLTASFLIRTNANTVGNGSMGLFLGPGLGHSPMFVLLTNANSGTGTGTILVATNFELRNAGPYVPNSTYEITLEADVDNQNYDVFARNVTAGTPAVRLTGPGPGGTFPFFGGGIPDDGDGETFTLDASLLLRSGTGRIDNVNLVGAEFVRAVWSFNVSSDWHQNSSWIPNLIPGLDPGRQIAVFGNAIQSPQTIFTNSTVSVNGIEFDNANTYVIAGGGSVELKANPASGANPTINVASGSHEFQIAVSFADDTTVTVAEGASLDFNNVVDLGGNMLAASGAVDLNFGVTGSGAIASSGSLGTAGTTPIVADLNSTGTLVVDLGPNNVDFFNITGNATLSGLLDVVLEPGFMPTGPYTVLTASGALNAAGLALDASDTEMFSLGIVGKSLVLTVGGAGVAGDYNRNGTVDAADYVLWRDTVGQTGTGLAADGDGNNAVNQADYSFWRARFGNSSGSGAALAAVPEPASAVLNILAMGACAMVGRSNQRHTS